MEGTIKVIFSEGSTKKSGNNRTVINTRTGQKETDSTVKEKSSLTDVSNHAFKNYVIGQVKRTSQVLVSEAIYEVNKYFDLTDNVESKRDMNIAISLASRGTKFATATMSGFAVGGVAGAVIGFAAAAVNEAVSIYQGYDKQNIQLRQLQTQLEYTRERAGYSLTSGSIGENK